jgi:hypothetical protein
MMTRENNEVQYPTYSDITHWIFECNRYLFLAKVHRKDSTVEPEMSGDPVAFVNKLLTSKKMSQNGSNVQYKLKFQKNQSEEYLFPKVIELPLDISEEDVLALDKTIKNIKLKNWDDLDDDKIIHAQGILLKYLNKIDDEINKETNTFSKCY